MKIMVTGANGLLGQSLIPLLLEKGHYNVFATGIGPSRIEHNGKGQLQYQELDLRDGVAVHAFVETVQPAAIIHAAALTQVDDCETNKVDCWNINVTATRFLVDAAKKISAYFLLVSTDFIFDGLHGPYDEDAIPNPVNYYGSSKWAAEKSVLEADLKAGIARTCLVYGNNNKVNRGTILHKICDHLQEGKSLKLVGDQFRTPTYVTDLANGLELMLSQKATGIFNISGNEMLSPYQMGIQLAALLEKDAQLLEEVNAGNFTQTAKRPAKTGFIIDKATKLLGYHPRSFAEGLKKMELHK